MRRFFGNLWPLSNAAQSKSPNLQDHQTEQPATKLGSRLDEDRQRSLGSKAAGLASNALPPFTSTSELALDQPSTSAQTCTPNPAPRKDSKGQASQDGEAPIMTTHSTEEKPNTSTRATRSHTRAATARKEETEQERREGKAPIVPIHTAETQSNSPAQARIPASSRRQERIEQKDAEGKTSRVTFQLAQQEPNNAAGAHDQATPTHKAQMERGNQQVKSPETKKLYTVKIPKDHPLYSRYKPRILTQTTPPVKKRRSTQTTPLVIKKRPRIRHTFKYSDQIKFETRSKGHRSPKSSDTDSTPPEYWTTSDDETEVEGANANNSTDQVWKAPARRKFKNFGAATAGEDGNDDIGLVEYYSTSVDDDDDEDHITRGPRKLSAVTVKRPKLSTGRIACEDGNDDSGPVEYFSTSDDDDKDYITLGTRRLSTATVKRRKLNTGGRKKVKRPIQTRRQNGRFVSKQQDMKKLKAGVPTPRSSPDQVRQSGCRRSARQSVMNAESIRSITQPSATQMIVQDDHMKVDGSKAEAATTARAKSTQDGAMDIDDVQTPGTTQTSNNETGQSMGIDHVPTSPTILSLRKSALATPPTQDRPQRTRTTTARLQAANESVTRAKPGLEPPRVRSLRYALAQGRTVVLPAVGSCTDLSQNPLPFDADDASTNAFVAHMRSVSAMGLRDWVVKTQGLVTGFRKPRKSELERTMEEHVKHGRMVCWGLADHLKGLLEQAENDAGQITTTSGFDGADKIASPVDDAKEFVQNTAEFVRGDEYDPSWSADLRPEERQRLEDLSERDHTEVVDRLALA